MSGQFGPPSSGASFSEQFTPSPRYKEKEAALAAFHASLRDASPTHATAAENAVAEAGLAPTTAVPVVETAPSTPAAFDTLPNLTSSSEIPNPASQTLHEPFGTAVPDLSAPPIPAAEPVARSAPVATETAPVADDWQARWQGIETDLQAYQLRPEFFMTNTGIEVRVFDDTHRLNLAELKQRLTDQGAASGQVLLQKILEFSFDAFRARAENPQALDGLTPWQTVEKPEQADHKQTEEPRQSWFSKLMAKAGQALDGLAKKWLGGERAPATVTALVAENERPRVEKSIEAARERMRRELESHQQLAEEVRETTRIKLSALRLPRWDLLGLSARTLSNLVSRWQTKITPELLEVQNEDLEGKRLFLQEKVLDLNQQIQEWEAYQKSLTGEVLVEAGYEPSELTTNQKLREDVDRELWFTKQKIMDLQQQRDTLLQKVNQSSDGLSHSSQGNTTEASQAQNVG